MQPVVAARWDSPEDLPAVQKILLQFSARAREVNSICVAGDGYFIAAISVVYGALLLPGSDLQARWPIDRRLRRILFSV
jgi:hypothetical protein